MTLSDPVLDAIRAHAAQVFPRECCGVLVVAHGKHKYFPCRNLAGGHEHFVLDPEGWAAAEDAGTPILVVHSHPNLPPVPSQADLVGCEQSGLPWMILSWPTGTTHFFEPSGYEAPLVGRQFSYGILDCFTLIQDYYRRNLGIELKTPYRPDEWWLKGGNLYVDSADEWGFDRVETPARHDVLLMQVASPVPNHAALWLGDGTILHHQMGRLSSRDVYGGWYRKITTHVYRHRELPC